MYATFVLDLNWELKKKTKKKKKQKKKQKKKKNGEYMLQVRNLDLPSSHHYQDRSDTIDLLEGWSGGAKVSFILRRWGVQLILAHKLGKPCYPCSR